MAKFTLRVPSGLVNKLDALAHRTGASRNQYILDVLSQHVQGYDPGLILGYWQLSQSELSPDDECPECGTPFGDGGIWLGITAAFEVFGPVCGECARTD